MKIFRDLAFAALAVSLPLAASASGDNTEKMLRQIQAQLDELTAKVTRLEALQPTFTTMMPEVAERFHVMHRAGDAGDWAVAGHELSEIKRIIGSSTNIDTSTGQMMMGFMTGPMGDIAKAVEEGDEAKFDRALENTVKSCNACHKASGSEFIQVTLNADRSLSMRHPHALQTSAQAMGHAHGDEGGHGEEEEKGEHVDEKPHGGEMKKMMEDAHEDDKDKH